MKKIFILFILLVIVWAGFFVWNHVTDKRIASQVAQAIATRNALEIEAGETPEETFSFFLDALRDNDLDRAVQYFVSESRNGWRLHFQNLYDKKFLDSMIADLENREEDAPLSSDHFREINGQWRLVSL